MERLENFAAYNPTGVLTPIRSGGDFPLMEAHDIQTKEDGTRLDEELETIKADIESLKNNEPSEPSEPTYEWIDVTSIASSAFSCRETFEEGVLPYIQDATKFRVEVNNHEKNNYNGIEHGVNWETWNNLRYECIFIPESVSDNIFSAICNKHACSRPCFYDTVQENSIYRRSRQSCS